MLTIRNVLYVSTFSVLALGLTGCESMKAMRDSISSIDFPYFGDPETTTAQKMATDEDGILATNTVGCPQVAVVEDLKTLTQFETPSKPTPGTKISSITLSGIKSACNITKNTVAVDIGLRFEGHLGPQADEWKTQSRSFAYPYFIAVTTQSGEIISKEVFAATISYEKAEKALIQEESIRQVIPLRNGMTASSYEILVGFQLTDDELNYSRMMISKPADTAAKPKKKSTKAKAPKKAAEKATTEPVAVTPQETETPAAAEAAPATDAAPVATPLSAVPTTENVVVETPAPQPVPTTTDGSVTAAPTATEVKQESATHVTPAATPAEAAPAPTPAPLNTEAQGPAQAPAAVNPYAPTPTQVITIQPDGTVKKN